MSFGGGDLGGRFAGALNIAAPDGVWARQCLATLVYEGLIWQILFAISCRLAYHTQLS